MCVFLCIGVERRSGHAWFESWVMWLFSRSITTAALLLKEGTNSCFSFWFCLRLNIKYLSRTVLVIFCHVIFFVHSMYVYVCKTERKWLRRKNQDFLHFTVLIQSIRHYHILVLLRSYFQRNSGPTSLRLSFRISLLCIWINRIWESVVGSSLIRSRNVKW